MIIFYFSVSSSLDYILTEGSLVPACLCRFVDSGFMGCFLLSFVHMRCNHEEAGADILTTLSSACLREKKDANTLTVIIWYMH